MTEVFDGHCTFSIHGIVYRQHEYLRLGITVKRQQQGYA